MNNPFTLPTTVTIKPTTPVLIELDRQLLCTTLSDDAKKQALIILTDYLRNEPLLRIYFTTRVVDNMRRYTLDCERQNADYMYRLWHNSYIDEPVWLDSLPDGSYELAPYFMQVSRQGEHICRTDHELPDFQAMYKALSKILPQAGTEPVKQVERSTVKFVTVSR